MRDFFMKFRKDESGATLAEYGIALIVGIVLGGTALGVLATDIDTQVRKPGTIYGDAANN